jgi:hypothetical protein
VGERSYPGERALRRSEVDEISGGDLSAVVRRIPTVDANDAVGIGVGQRVEQCALDDGVHRRRRADAKGERDERYRGKPRILTQGAPRLSQVEAEILEPLRAASHALTPSVEVDAITTGVVDVSELTFGLAASLGDREAARGPQLRGAHVEVELQLLIEVATDLRRGAAREAEDSWHRGATPLRPRRASRRRAPR